MKKIVFIAVAVLAMVSLAGCDAVLESFYPEFAEGGDVAGEVEVFVSFDDDDYNLVKSFITKPSEAGPLRLILLDLTPYIEDGLFAESDVTPTTLADVYNGAIVLPDDSEFDPVWAQARAESQYEGSQIIAVPAGAYAVLMFADVKSGTENKVDSGDLYAAARVFDGTENGGPIVARIDDESDFVSLDTFYGSWSAFLQTSVVN